MPGTIAVGAISSLSYIDSRLGFIVRIDWLGTIFFLTGVGEEEVKKLSRSLTIDLADSTF